MLDTILTPRVLAVVGVVCLALMAFAAGWAFFKVCYQKALGRPVPRNWLTNGCDVVAEIGNNIPGAINRALKLAGKPGLFLPTQPADGSAPTASAATIDVLSTENAALREALAALQRRVGESQGVAHPAQLFAPTFDAGQRQTIAPEVVAAARAATREGQRGHTSLSAALAAVALIGIVAAVGLMAMGCPVSQQLTRPALGPVDGCEPRSTRCAPDGRPQVCSGSRRWTDADVACVTAGQVAAVCCLTTSPITGRELHACVLAERCLPVDGGAR